MTHSELSYHDHLVRPIELFLSRIHFKAKLDKKILLPQSVYQPPH